VLCETNRCTLADLVDAVLDECNSLPQKSRESRAFVAAHAAQCFDGAVDYRQKLADGSILLVPWEGVDNVGQREYRRRVELRAQAVLFLKPAQDAHVIAESALVDSATGRAVAIHPSSKRDVTARNLLAQHLPNVTLPTWRRPPEA
jgi:hypothetical protein